MKLADEKRLNDDNSQGRDNYIIDFRPIYSWAVISIYFFDKKSKTVVLPTLFYLTNNIIIFVHGWEYLIIVS